jgi:hypothetical protein
MKKMSHLTNPLPVVYVHAINDEALNFNGERRLFNEGTRLKQHYILA